MYCMRNNCVSSFFEKRRKMKELHLLQKELQVTKELYDYYSQLCVNYLDITYEIQFKEWNICHCQYIIDEYKIQTSTSDKIILNKISECETKKEVYIAELKLLQDDLVSKKDEYNLIYETYCELSMHKQQLNTRILHLV